MKKYYIYTLMVISVFGGFAYADDGGYTITNYNANMELQTNASMDVSEKIDVNFSEDRHGIYRQIPIKDPAGDYVNISNFDAGEDSIADSSQDSENYILKIGSADKTIIGPHIYNITYTVNNAIKAYAGSGQSSGRDEFYRNIIGPDRATTISGLKFTINVPTDYKFSSGDMFLYYGKYGDKLTDGAKIYQSGSQIIGYINKILEPNTSATVGLKFPAGYFQVKSDYNDYFQNSPEDDNSGIFAGLGIFAFIFIFIFYQSWIYAKKDKNGYRKSDRSVTIYYKPPADISPSEAFYFWYNNKDNPKVFTAILYYRCTRGWTKIEKVEGSKLFLGLFKGSDTYHIVENSYRPTQTDPVDDRLMQKFFGVYDNTKDDVTFDNDAYDKIIDTVSSLESYFDTRSQKYITRKVNIWSLFGGADKLTTEGENLYEQMRGFKEYLSKVEKPVLQKELEANPEFFNTIIPRAVLFGVETKVLQAAENILSQVKRYNSYDGSYLNYYAFNNMTSSIATSAIAPRSDSSSSGFGGGGGGGFSGGGGGGGGGGSW